MSLGASTERDSRIDFLRGFFILSMCLDHLGFLLQGVGNNASLKLYTYQSLGWSSAAEFFVFFSGYVIATVYSRSLVSRGFWNTQVRGLHRAWELYVRNGFVFLAVLAVVPWIFSRSNGLIDISRLDLAANYGERVILAFMRFEYFPAFLEVLPLYMVLIAMAPGFLYLYARVKWLPMLLSAFVWLAVQLHPSLNFYTPGGWHFNPLAWQFVFFLGVWTAKEWPLGEVDRSSRGRKITWVLAVLALCTVLKLMDKADVRLPLIGVLDIPWLDKTNMQPIRLLHFLLVVRLVALLMPSNAWIKRHLMMRGVARVGTHSLDCFSTSIVSCYVLAGLFSWSERGSLEYLSVQFANLLLIVLLALWFQWIKTPPWRAPPGGSIRIQLGADDRQRARTSASTLQESAHA